MTASNTAFSGQSCTHTCMQGAQCHLRSRAAPALRARAPKGNKRAPEDSTPTATSLPQETHQALAAQDLGQAGCAEVTEAPWVCSQHPHKVLRHVFYRLAAGRNGGEAGASASGGSSAPMPSQCSSATSHSTRLPRRWSMLAQHAVLRRTGRARPPAHQLPHPAHNAPKRTR